MVTLLPVENLETLSAARFQFCGQFFFPNSRISLEEVGQRARALDERVRRLAEARGFRVVGPRAAWYGFDPIHIRSRQMTTAWREILTADRLAPTAIEPVRTSLARAVYLHSRTPFHRYFLGFEQRRAQPSARLAGRHDDRDLLSAQSIERAIVRMKHDDSWAVDLRSFKREEATCTCSARSFAMQARHRAGRVARGDAEQNFCTAESEKKFRESQLLCEIMLHKLAEFVQILFRSFLNLRVFGFLASIQQRCFARERL